MATKIEKWIKKLEKRQVKLAKERDELDNCILEMEGLRDCCGDAWDSLQEARDKLSELV
ncbi:MAG: hypothetical protein KAJ73_00590 [Zetaproteobacteria bacterium]|nr:hypothetical protein [Zetaproteobacteria bacterium]